MGSNDIESGTKTNLSSSTSSSLTFTGNCKKAALELLQPVKGSSSSSANSRTRRKLHTNPKDPLALGKRLVWKDIQADVPVETNRFSLIPCGDTPMRTVLNKVGGVAQPGELTFIMGASGAGKTTLLNVLTQRNLTDIQVYGDIRINGHSINPGDIHKISAYVQQEDIFIGDLTVREAIVLNARLRMKSKYTLEERMQRVDEVIKNMGLVSCENTCIGGRHRKSISRGEMKRLAFACEVLTDPPILFCDEPTSGLDAFMAMQVVAVMKRFASEGKTVVSTIHQPSSQVFELADTVILMANGVTAYQGPAHKIVDFFTGAGFPMTGGHMNPADHFMRVMSRSEVEREDVHQNRVQTIIDAYKSSDYGEEVRAYTHFSTPSNTERRLMREDYQGLRKYKAGWFEQLWLLYIRSLKVILRNPLVLRIRFAQMIVIAMVIGLVYNQTQLRHTTIQNFVGLLYNSVRDMSFLFIFPCIIVFTEELIVVRREYKAGMYTPTAYFVAKNLADGIQYIAFPIIYSIVVYFSVFKLSDINEFSTTTAAPLMKFFGFTLTNVMEAQTAVSIGYLAACAFGTVDIASQFLPLIVVPLMVLGGFFINLGSIPPYFRWISHVSYFRIAFEAHINNMILDVDTVKGCDIAENYRYCHLTNASVPHGPQMLDYLHMRPNFYWFDLGILLIEMLVIRLFSVIAFHIRLGRH